LARYHEKTAFHGQAVTKGSADMTDYLKNTISAAECARIEGLCPRAVRGRLQRREGYGFQLPNGEWCIPVANCKYPERAANLCKLRVLLDDAADFRRMSTTLSRMRGHRPTQAVFPDQCFSDFSAICRMVAERLEALAYGGNLDPKKFNAAMLKPEAPPKSFLTPEHIYSIKSAIGDTESARLRAEAKGDFHSADPAMHARNTLWMMLEEIQGEGEAI
jgi:hypothetical protein